MKFAEWLFQQIDRDDYIGDLARRVEDDELFPESGGRAIYEGYFETFDAEVQAQFDRVWDAWEAEA
jgi:uncharacterized protein YozE (UPF0346 family)